MHIYIYYALYVVNCHICIKMYTIIIVYCILCIILRNIYLTFLNISQLPKCTSLTQSFQCSRRCKAQTTGCQESNLFRRLSKRLFQVFPFGMDKNVNICMWRFGIRKVLHYCKCALMCAWPLRKNTKLNQESLETLNVKCPKSNDTFEVTAPHGAPFLNIKNPSSLYSLWRM